MWQVGTEVLGLDVQIGWERVEHGVFYVLFSQSLCIPCSHSPKLETISRSRSTTTSCALIENEILGARSPLLRKFQIYF